ncbi:MAG: carbohydrate binding family 9 domain-containing protein, partial [Vicinamibacterales bacterium]
MVNANAGRYVRRARSSASPVVRVLSLTFIAILLSAQAFAQSVEAPIPDRAEVDAPDSLSAAVSGGTAAAVGAVEALLPPGSYDDRYQPAVSSASRAMRAEPLRREERVVLDGILDEAVWKRAVPASDFVQQDPVQGGEPTELTEVRIAFSKTALYMGVTCLDSEPDKLLGNTMKRDEFLQGDDRFMWTMDTFLDRQTGYFFEMNPAGLMADSYMGTSGDNRNWDGIWNARVRRSEVGWTIELEIPFTTLSFDPKAPAWGVNFQRSIRRKNEENVWTGHMRNQGLRRMANAGLLVGINQVSQGVGLDVRPYAAANVSDAPGADVPSPFGGGGAMGLDLLYNITPSLRGNLTLNTDFAETEVDQRLVNLTRFPLFFPERRTFFLDGATFFDFYRGAGGGGNNNNNNNNSASPTRPFFSRQVGLDANGLQQPIDIGAKLTGQVGKQDVGVLLLRTRETDTSAGEDFAVVRGKRRFWRQSYVAGIYTGRHSRGGALAGRHTAGMDLRLQTNQFRGSQNVEFDAFYLWTTQLQRLGNSASYGARLGFPNVPWEGSLSWEVVEPNHAPSIGFVPRKGFKNLSPR